jgi:Protein of unknown function (DUF1488)
MMPIFAFPEDAHWNESADAIEFAVELGEYRGNVRVGRAVFRALLGQTATPESCLAAYHLERTRFERASEEKIRRRELTADGNIDLTGRDLRRV